MAEPAFELINGGAVSPVILLAEHAGRIIPGDGTLGIDPALLDRERNLPFDHGVAGIVRQLAVSLGATAILGRHSRLWIDLNRAEGADDLIPAAAHGHAIPGNQATAIADLPERMAIYRAYHAAVGQQIERHLQAGCRPLLFSVHSFTPAVGLRQAVQTGRAAPDVGLLYLHESTAVKRLRNSLRQDAVEVADNFPYDLRSVPPGGLHRHGTAHDLPVMGVEVSIDTLHTEADERAWSLRLCRGLTAG